MVTLAEVLGSTAQARIPRAYVERAGVDDRFVDALVDATHISVYGTPGVGKTALIQKHVEASQLLYVECLKGQQAPDVYRSILAEAGARVKTETKLTKKRQLSATLKIFSAGSERDVESTETEVTIDLGNVGDVFRTLAARTDRPLIVLNDFQALSRGAQRRVVRDLQYIFERTQARLILVGTWSSPAYLTDLSELLPSFLADIPVPAWSDAEASALLTRVEQLLGVMFRAETRGALIETSAGSVRELTEMCRALLNDLGVQTEQKPRRDIAADRLAVIGQRRAARLYERYRTLLAGYLTMELASTSGVDLGRFLLNGFSDVFEDAAPEGEVQQAAPAGGEGAQAARYSFEELQAALAGAVDDTNAPLEVKQRRRRALIEALRSAAQRDGSEVAVAAEDFGSSASTEVAIDEESLRASSKALVKAQAAAGFYPPLVAYDPRSQALIALEPKFRAFLRTAAGDIGALEHTNLLRVDGPRFTALAWTEPTKQRAAINRWRSHHPQAAAAPGSPEPG